MQNEGCSLQQLTHRLGECPADFLAEPAMNGQGEVFVAAVVGDVLRDFRLGVPLELPAFFGATGEAANAEKRNWLQLVLVASWLLHDDWFLALAQTNIEYSKSLWTWISTGLNDLSLVVEAPQFVSDADRREELARLALAALGLRPQGENVAQSQSRLTTLDSIERQRVVLQTRKAQQRAQEIREAMQEKARQEAAARYTRE